MTTPLTTVLLPFYPGFTQFSLWPASTTVRATWKNKYIKMFCILDQQFVYSTVYKAIYFWSYCKRNFWASLLSRMPVCCLSSIGLKRGFRYPIRMPYSNFFSLQEISSNLHGSKPEKLANHIFEFDVIDKVNQESIWMKFIWFWFWIFRHGTCFGTEITVAGCTETFPFQDILVQVLRRYWVHYFSKCITINCFSYPQY